MNKRIRELADQVRFVDTLEYPHQDEVFQKFAELIVRECAKVASENVGAFTPGCGNAVLEHFGIKE